MSQNKSGFRPEGMSDLVGDAENSNYDVDLFIRLCCISTLALDMIVTLPELVLISFWSTPI
jgi:hypothetical protein